MGSKNLNQTSTANDLFGMNKGQMMLNKVPQITIFFWIIKVLCTTVGETASDFLNVNLGFGLTGTSIVMGLFLLIVLYFQFKSRKYTPGIYWLAVVLISIFGTLVTDNMTDAMGIPLEVSTIVFSAALVLTFAIWYGLEKTLSIHSIFTIRRETFYWLTVLFTFALGTAAGDLMAESLGLGYLLTGIIVSAVIVSVFIAWRFGLDSVLSFWIAYIMTRPLGASLGDYLSQPHKYGGLGFGATITSAIFIAAILLTVLYLSVSKLDLTARKNPITQTNAANINRPAIVLQVVTVICVLVLASGTGYYWRHTKLMNDAKVSASQALIQGKTAGYGTQVSSLGDLTSFQTIEKDTLNLVEKGDLSAAKLRVNDLEYTWDNSEASLRPRDKTKWTEIDNTIDDVLTQIRSVNPDPAACKSAIETSLAALS